MVHSLLAANGGDIITYVLLGVMVVAIIAMFVFSSRRRKKQEADAQNLINAVKPGNKVKTIGGICGIVVEVDSEENTFVLETGTELSGKCYIKFDRQAIYQTDAVVEKPESKEESKDEPKEEEQKTAEETNEVFAPAEAAEPVEPAAEPVAEPSPEEKPAKSNKKK